MCWRMQRNAPSEIIVNIILQHVRGKVRPPKHFVITTAKSNYPKIQFYMHKVASVSEKVASAVS